MICIVYVDDCLFFSKDINKVNAMLQKLQNEELHFSREDNVSSFLGVDMSRKSDGTIEMRQTGLIDNIIDAMQLDDENPKDTPADTVLAKDTEG